MKIRFGKKSDWKALYKILNKTPELQSMGDKNNYQDYLVKYFLADMKRNLCLIVEENRKIVGFILAEMWKGRKSSFLVDLYVNPDFRGRGVAKALFDKYSDICKKEGFVSLGAMTFLNNKPALKFFESRGFSKGNRFFYLEKKI